MTPEQGPESEREKKKIMTKDVVENNKTISQQIVVGNSCCDINRGRQTRRLTDQGKETFTKRPLLKPLSSQVTICIPKAVSCEK